MKAQNEAVENQDQTFGQVFGDITNVDTVTGEVLPAVATVTYPATIGTSRFKIKRQVTRTPLSLLPEQPVFIRIESKYYELPAEVTIKQAKGQQRPIILDVTDLETGVGHSMMMYTVLQSELDKAYPDQTFVGKCFMLVRHDMQGSKGYCTFDIAEVEAE